MKIGITGYTGRVGALLIQELQSGNWPGLELAGGAARKAPETDPGFFTTINPAELFERADAVIDFTLPETVQNHAALAAENGTALIVGTTGLSKIEEQYLADAATQTSIVYAANMSVGVNLLMALVEQAAARLGPEWDIEIFEAHHKHKIDAPSGTALALGKAAQAGRGSGDFVHDRNGKRNNGDIGFSVARGGDVVGEHMVTFYTDGERLELGHKASDRSLFAKGALRAASWVKDKPPGLYSMRDVLDI